MTTRIPGDRSRVVLAVGPTLEDSITTLSSQLEDLHPPTVMLPASLNHRDRLGAIVRRRIAPDARIVIPEGGKQLLVALATGHPMGWTRRSAEVPGSDRLAVRLPASLVRNPGGLWSVTDINAVAASGPFALDVIARYVHPRDRLGILASRERAQRSVEVNLVLAPAACLFAAGFDGITFAGVTSDPVAAELVCLALAERIHGRGDAMSGPWEDRVVQRATELQLGAAIPDEIRFSVMSGSSRHPLAVDIVEHACARIGVVPSFTER